MPDRDISPTPDSPTPQREAHYRAEDDIELPPLPASEATHAAGAGRSETKGGGGQSKGFSSLLGAAVLMGAIAFGGWYFLQSSSAEKAHPNWQHVAAAADASDSDTSQLVCVDASGNPQVLPAIEVSAADLDRSSTRQIRAALRRNDLMMANAVLQAAQKMPSASQNPDVRPPQLAAESELSAALSDGRQELFQIELFDCCDEDGDIVEVFVNGTSFATVPIMHGGSMLSIPLQSGHNTVTIRGVKDGGGGVTLSFRTSRGEYFARSMRVGEQYQMEVVVR
jgi:hypothetical protein